MIIIIIRMKSIGTHGSWRLWGSAWTSRLRRHCWTARWGTLGRGGCGSSEQKKALRLTGSSSSIRVRWVCMYAFTFGLVLYSTVQYSTVCAVDLVPQGTSSARCGERASSTLTPQRNKIRNFFLQSPYSSSSIFVTLFLLYYAILTRAELVHRLHPPLYSIRLRHERRSRA